MHQAIDYLYEQELSVATENFGTFLKWLADDIIKEESDTMNTSNIDPKDVSRAIMTKAKAWFQEQLFLYFSQ